MATWLSVLEIDVSTTPAVTWRCAMRDVACTATGAKWVAFGIVNSFYDFARAIPVQPGLPTTSALQVAINNNSLIMSRLAATYELRGKTARLKIGLSGTAYSTFSTHFTGRISNSLKITPALCTLDIQDGSTDSWREAIPNEITLADYPNLPKARPEARQNIIIGNCTSEGKTDQGAVNCPYVDTVDHLYHVAKHPCVEITNVYVLGAVETLTYEVVETDDGETLLHFFEDVEPTGGNASGFTVTADVKGLFDDDTSPSGPLVTNPAEAFSLYVSKYMRDVTLNTTAYNAAVLAYDSAIVSGFVAAGVIDWEGDHESVIASFGESFAMQTYFNATGELMIYFSDVETGDPSDPVYTSGWDIQRGSLLIEKSSVVNELQVHFDRDPVGGGEVGTGWHNEPPALANLLSQAALDATVKEDLELPLTADIETAEEVAKLRMYYGDEGRWLTTFELSSPQISETLDLGSRVKLTHPAGIGAAGWTAEPFKILQMRYLLAGAPKIRFTCLSLTPGSSAYLFRTASPINVTNAHATESAEGYVVADWDVPSSSPSAGTDPYTVEIWWKRAEDDFISKSLHYAGSSLASQAGTGHAFDAYCQYATSLDIYLRTVDSSGVKQALTISCAHVVHSTRTKITALAGVTAVQTGLTVVADWTAPIDPNELTMLREYEVWRGLAADLSDGAAIGSGGVATPIIETTYTDAYTNFTSAGPYYYAVRPRTRYGVLSDYSNIVGPIDMALELASVAITVDGPTFNGLIELPAGVEMSQIDHFEEAISETVWDPSGSPGNHPDDNSPFSIGLNLYPSGTEAEKTYYVAFRAYFTQGFYGAWTYLMDLVSPSNYGSVTSGTNAKIQSDDATNYWGAEESPSNRLEFNQVSRILTAPTAWASAFSLNHDSFTASGGETYIQLATAANLSKALIVAFATYGGSMTILRQDTHYTASNASGYTRIAILTTDSSPSAVYTFVAGDIAEIWSTPA